MNMTKSIFKIMSVELPLLEPIDFFLYCKDFMSIITRENPFILKTIEADKENLHRYVTLCDELERKPDRGSHGAHHGE